MSKVDNVSYMSKDNKDFDQFLGNLLFAYKQFCFSVKLDEKFTKHPPTASLGLFWFTTRLSLRRGYLAEISKLFEKQNSKFDDVLSIYYLMDIEFKDHAETISKLKKLRDKFLMHHDLKTARDLDLFVKQIDLSPKNIQDLFKKTFEVMEKLRNSYGVGGEIKHLFEGVEKKSGEEVDILLEKIKSK